MTRTCGCCNDDLQTRRALQDTLARSSVTDDGRLIRIGVIFHICQQNPVVSSVEADVRHVLASVNADFARSPSNFDAGSGVYTDPELRTLYSSYVSLATVSRIEFYLVEIRYTPLPQQTSTSTRDLDISIKRKYPAILPEKYLNLWVVDLFGGLLGYAQFPWTDSPSTDGVVINRAVFGRNPADSSFSLNKTTTHEIGHWLGLYHTFQRTTNYEGGNFDYRGGSGTPEELEQQFRGDCVIDTPPQGVSTTGNPLLTPSTWPISRPSDAVSASRHMYMNYMDYTDDAGMFMFTRDQVKKMRIMMYLYRSSILGVATPDFENLRFSFGDLVKLPIKFLVNSLASNARISDPLPGRSSKTLLVRKTSFAEIPFNAEGATNLRFNFNALIGNPNTYIWVQSPGALNWQGIRLPMSSVLSRYTISVPPPYTLSTALQETLETRKKPWPGSIIMRLRLGSIGGTGDSYFEDVEVVDIPVENARSTWGTVIGITAAVVGVVADAVVAVTL